MSTIAFWRAVGDPLLQHSQLCVGQTPDVHKVAFPRVRLPGRHDPAGGNHGNLRGATPHVVVRHQAERPDLAGSMARRAAMPHDWRNVFVKSELRLRA
jgi:hypothetical protein